VLTRLRSAGPRLLGPLVAVILGSFTSALTSQSAAAATNSGLPVMVGIAASHDGHGYWLASSGNVYAFGTAVFAGPQSPRFARPVSGVVAAPGGGYWLVASDGGVFAYGGAPFLGSTGAMHLNAPVVGIAATPSGQGYWLVASDGGIFSFGDAQFAGSTGAMHLNSPVVGIAATPSGRGYWLVASDGGIFSFGDAHFLGSTGAMHLNSPVVGMASTPSGSGYWLVASDGGVFTFGDAPFHGSTGAVHLVAPISGLAATPDGAGYWMVAQDGGVFTFGDAPFAGAATGFASSAIADVAARPECGVPADAVTAGKVIVVSLVCQELTAYENRVPFVSTLITTGRPALPTPPGQYSVLSKISPYQMVSPWPPGSPFWYPPSWTTYTLWFRSDGYAIHDAPWRSVYGPGTQLNGSHGCINTPFAPMQKLYSWAPVGTAVRVY